MSIPVTAAPPPITPGGPARHVIAVGSGKGGVGKSTVSLNLALALAEMGAAVGLLDADVYGPNIPVMVNVTRHKRRTSFMLATAKGAPRYKPVEKFGLEIMSAGFLFGEDQAIAWDSNLVSALVSQLMNFVDWGRLDYLIVDLPPGTGEVQQAFAKNMLAGGFGGVAAPIGTDPRAPEAAKPLKSNGAVVVVTPQDIAHLDAKKAVDMYRHLNVPVIGAVENMSGLVCPHCSERIEVFHKVRQDRSIFETGVVRLGSIPLDPEMSRSTDDGRPVFVDQPQSVQAQAFRFIALGLVDALGEKMPVTKKGGKP